MSANSICHFFSTVNTLVLNFLFFILLFYLKVILTVLILVQSLHSFHKAQKKPFSRLIYNIWCGWRDSNPHGCPPDPKSGASANFATPAFLNCSVILAYIIHKSNHFFHFFKLIFSTIIKLVNFFRSFYLYNYKVAFLP